MSLLKDADLIKVYISGPYTKGDPVINTRNAIEAGNEILSYGHIPIIPHLTMFWHLLTPRPWQDWIDYDLHLVGLCGIILRLPGESTGADMEVEEARRLRLVVTHSVEEAKRAIDVQYCRGGF